MYENKITHASLCTGIGGFDYAAEQAGFENIFQVEIDLFCQKVLNKNFPNTKKYLDVKKFNGKEYKNKITVLSAGFPCQPFSVAGNRKGKEDDRFIWSEINRVISEVKPKYVILENVTGIISLALEQVLFDLESQNFQVEVFIIPAVAKNAPHRRDRIWIIGYNDRTSTKNKISARWSISRSKISNINSNIDNIRQYGAENIKGSNKRSDCNSERKNKFCESKGSNCLRSDSSNNNGTRKLQSKRNDKELRERNCNCTEDVADIASKGCEGFEQCKFSRSGTNEGSTNNNEFVTNSECFGQQGQGEHRGQLRSKKDSKWETSWTINGNQFKRNWIEVAAELCRVDDGVSKGLDKNKRKRIASLGNAIVPQVAYEFFKIIYILELGK